MRKNGLRSWRIKKSSPGLLKELFTPAGWFVIFWRPKRQFRVDAKVAILALSLGQNNQGFRFHSVGGIGTENVK
jgi:hypothetical protein